MTENVVRLLLLGGPVVVVLLLASLFGLALALRKFIQFRQINADNLAVLNTAINDWHQGDFETATAALSTSPLSLAKDLAYGLAANTDPVPTGLRNELVRRASALVRDYARGLRTLEIIYYLAPVLGLLGTVLGMIDAFRGLATHADSASAGTSLANGIWEALLTTAVGLTIAIVFTILHAMLSTKLQAISHELSDLVDRVLGQ